MVLITDNSSINLSLTNLWHAWSAFRKGKQPSRDIIRFEVELERNLLLLCLELNNGTYKHGGYNHRIVNEKKRRDIAVATVRDRVVHRLLYDYMVPFVDKTFDPDVWSCRKGRGLHGALERTHNLIRRYEHGWFWRADISKFFDHVDHDVLRRCLKLRIADEVALVLLDKVISSYKINEPASQPASRGIPIGNLTSQLFANIYLNELDIFIRQTIKPYAYLRYGDDFVLFTNSQSSINKMQQATTVWLEDRLYLQVHKKNNIVRSSNSGLHFLGHRIHPSSPVCIDPFMSKKVWTITNSKNIASFTAMHLTLKQRKSLPWLLIESSD